MGIGIENRVMGFWEMSASPCRRLSGCLLRVVEVVQVFGLSKLSGCQVIKFSPSHCQARPVLMVIRLIKLVALRFQLLGDQKANPLWTTPTTALADNQTTRTTRTKDF